MADEVNDKGEENNGMTYQITELSNSRYDSFYILYLLRGGKVEKYLTPTIFTSTSNLNGKIPQGIDMFTHIKICLIFGTRFFETISDELKNKIFKESDSKVKVGEISIVNLGKFFLYIDNLKKVIYIKDK